MGQVEITINGRPYQVACDDGEENHLLDLAGQVNRRVDELASTVGQVGEARLILMAGLLLADELLETQEEMSKAQTKETNGRTNTESIVSEETGKAVATLDAVTQKIETIVARLESA